MSAAHLPKCEMQIKVTQMVFAQTWLYHSETTLIKIRHGYSRKATKLTVYVHRVLSQLRLLHQSPNVSNTQM